MKKVLKVFFSLLLAALIIGAALFFFVFRTDLTASGVNRLAQKQDELGRYDRAIWLYKAADRLHPDLDGIEMGLCDAYLHQGNFTKAEYTLVSAITEDPGRSEYYIRLCSVYAMQDKLLDAQQMLDRISNDKVRREIDALRPAAPVAEPAGGFYSDYINVSVTSPDGTVYCVLNSEDSEEYPTLAQPCEGPVTLAAGPSKLYAITVGENGLVSPLLVEGYTIGNVVEEVRLQDAAVDEAVRTILGKTVADTIMSDELWTITDLVLEHGVSTLADLPLMPNLLHLTVHSASGLDLAPLSSMKLLESLDLSACTLSTNAMECVGTVVSLRELLLPGCALTNINPLVGLTELTTLNLSNNSISDLTALGSMAKLERLAVNNNPLSGIGALTACTALQELQAENCGLRYLNSLTDHRELTTLLLAGNKIADISQLSGCTALQKLDVQNNEIPDISVLPSLPALEFFYGGQNAITEIPDFDETTCKLVRFEVPYNQITDVSGLGKLQELNFFNGDYNQIADITPLTECFRMIQILVWDNPIYQEPIELANQCGIIVNYNPEMITEKPEEPPAAE